MIDGPEKVSGRAKYTADLIAPGMLAGRIYRSPYSHAEILGVDVSEALKLPGAKAIVTGADCASTCGGLPVARSGRPLSRGTGAYRGGATGGGGEWWGGGGGRGRGGGGCGRRTAWLSGELSAALAARKTGGTGRMVVNREETFIAHGGGPETDIRLKLGMTKEGRITAV